MLVHKRHRAALPPFSCHVTPVVLENHSSAWKCIMLIQPHLGNPLSVIPPQFPLFSGFLHSNFQLSVVNRYGPEYPNRGAPGQACESAQLDTSPVTG